MSTLPYKYEEYKYFLMSQRQGVSAVFKAFLLEEDFDVVIEIGTWWGGFAYMLSDIVGSKLYTYDIEDNTTADVRDLLVANGSHFYIENVFESESILKLIEGAGRVLLLCDGGDKSKEIEKFGALLKENDIIMAHDFFVSKEEHDPTHWRSCEVTAKDFDYSYLESYKNYTDLFTPYVWGIRIKKT